MVIETSADFDLAATFKALGDPRRLTLIQLLARADDSICVCDLTACVPLSQPTVSHHLKILAEAGLVEREQDGRWAYYRIAEDRLGDVIAALQNLGD